MIEPLYMTPDRMLRIKEHVEKVSLELDQRPIIECGVAAGYSLSEIAVVLEENKMINKLIGLDTFAGLPETEGNWKEGQFCHSFEEIKTNLELKLPTYHDKIVLVKGRVEETLNGNFAQEHLDEQGIALLHIDTDLYSACKTILNYFRPYFKNTWVIFDEWNGGEGTAWQEFVEANSGVHYKEYGVAANQQVIKIYG